MVVDLCLDDLGVSKGSLLGNLGGSLVALRNILAASQEDGSNRVVGVLFLSLHTLNTP